MYHHSENIFKQVIIMNSRELEKYILKLHIVNNLKVDVQVVSAPEVQTIQLKHPHTIIIAVVNRDSSSNVAHFVVFVIKKSGKDITCDYFDPLAKKHSVYFENFPFKVTEVDHRPVLSRDSVLSTLHILAYIYYRLLFDHEISIELLGQISDIDVFVHGIYDYLCRRYSIERTSTRGIVYYPGKASQIFRDYR